MVVSKFWMLRDPRILLNSPVTNPDDPNAEFKLRGRVVEIRDQVLREDTADAIEAASGWRPPEGWHFFSIDIEDAAFIAWEGGKMRMARWNCERGLDHVTRQTAVLDELLAVKHLSLILPTVSTAMLNSAARQSRYFLHLCRAPEG